METRRVVAAVALALAAVAAAALLAPHVPATLSASGTQETARVVVSDGERTLGTVTARVADSRTERVRGLSETDALAADEGMVFVYRSEASRTFWMKGVAFGLDIVFVGADGTITAIHHADAPPPDTPAEELRRYSGRARWVLEVPAGWTSRHNVSVGDSVAVEY
jgi:uncharacterized membrane protein (UPF0127 family)